MSFTISARSAEELLSAIFSTISQRRRKNFLRNFFRREAPKRLRVLFLWREAPERNILGSFFAYFCNIFLYLYGFVRLHFLQLPFYGIGAKKFFFTALFALSRAFLADVVAPSPSLGRFNHLLGLYRPLSVAS